MKQAHPCKDVKLAHQTVKLESRMNETHVQGYNIFLTRIKGLSEKSIPARESAIPECSAGPAWKARVKPNRTDEQHPRAEIALPLLPRELGRAERPRKLETATMMATKKRERRWRAQSCAAGTGRHRARAQEGKAGGTRASHRR